MWISKQSYGESLSREKADIATTFEFQETTLMAILIVEYSRTTNSAPYGGRGLVMLTLLKREMRDVRRDQTGQT